MLFLLCHPNWDIRRAAYNSTRRIVSATSQLSETLMVEFSSYLSVVGEKVIQIKMR